MDPHEVDNGEFTTVYNSLLVRDDAANQVTDSLFEDFKRCSDDFVQIATERPVDAAFELLRRYESLCTEQAAILRQLAVRSGGANEKFDNTMSMYTMLFRELCCWRLISALYRDRINVQPTQSFTQDSAQLSQCYDDMNVYEVLLKSRKDIRELKIILEWCQQCSRDELDIQDVEERFGNKTVSWEHSLHKLKSGTGGDSLISSMDPDAPLSGVDRRLDDADTETEEQLLATLFALVRCGEIQKAIDLCVHCGQSWRAAALQGYLLSSDANANVCRQGDVVQKLSGNTSRDLWKATCWKMAESPLVGPTEQALFGCLTGKLSSVLSRCDTWQDRLWAYTSASLEYHLSEGLKASAAARGKRFLPPTDDLSSATEDDRADFTLEEIFQEIEAALGPGTTDMYQSVCKWVMLGREQELIFEGHGFLNGLMTNFALTDDPILRRHLIRFLASLVLLFRQLEIGLPEPLSSNVVAMYVRQLIADRRDNLVAHYTSQLPAERQIDLYSLFMDKLTETSTRKEALRLADEAGLDVPALCTNVCVTACQRTIEFDKQSANDERNTSEEDLIDLSQQGDTLEDELNNAAISSLEWLLFDPRLRAVLLVQANNLMRHFIETNRVELAVQVVRRGVPTDSMDVLRVTWERDHGDTLLPAVTQNALKEFTGHKAYLQAHDAYTSWSRHFHGGKPTADEEDGEGVAAMATTRFADDARTQLKRRMHADAISNWQQKCNFYAQTAIEVLRHVLLFPDGGWMVDVETTTSTQWDDADGDDSSRRESLSRLRSGCLPMVASMLLALYRSTQCHLAAAQLAETIADENLALYKVFSKQSLRQFLRGVAEISVESVDKGTDALGYEQPT